MINKTITPEKAIAYVIEHFRYERETGRFFHLRPNIKNKCLYGSLAGHKQGDNSRYVLYVGKTLINRSRVVWLMETGKWPNGFIKHRNGNNLDDRFENLIDVSKTIKTEAPSNDMTGIIYMPRRDVYYVESTRKSYPDLISAQIAVSAT